MCLRSRHGSSRNFDSHHCKHPDVDPEHLDAAVRGCLCCRATGSTGVSYTRASTLYSGARRLKIPPREVALEMQNPCPNEGGVLGGPFLQCTGACLSEGVFGEGDRRKSDMAVVFWVIYLVLMIFVLANLELEMNW